MTAESTELVLSPKITPAEVFGKPGGAVPVVQEIEKFYRSIDRDISTKKGRDNVRSIAAKIRGHKADLEESGKAFKDVLKKQTDAIDAERRFIKDKLEELAVEIRAPLTEFEEKEKNRVAAHEAAILKLEAMTKWDGEFDPDEPTAQDYQNRIDLMPMNFNREWEEFKDRANLVKEKALTELATKLASRQKYEAEQEELVRLRTEKAAADKKAHEDKIAADAAEKARLEAEAVAAALLKAEQDKAAQEAAAAADALERVRAANAQAAIDAAVKLQEEQEATARAEAAAAEAKAAAETAALKAKADAEAAESRRQADLKAAAAKAEQDKQAAVQAEQKRAAEAKATEDAATAKREADKKHSAKINGEALEKLMEVVAKSLPPEAEFDKLGHPVAKAIVIAIAKGEIPHVSIKY